MESSGINTMIKVIITHHYEREETEQEIKQWRMFNGTYGVIRYKYYDKRNYYTPVMRGKKQRKKYI